jgi:hypothetical protein
MPDTPAPNELSSRMARMEGTMQAFQSALDSIDRRLLALAAEQRAEFRWLIGLLIALLLAMIGGFGTVLDTLSHAAK